jgi:response regulator of citrate/malate metabolism
MSNEIVSEGWAELAKILNISESTAKRRKKELEDAGVIFYLNVGRPVHKVMRFFISRLIAWAGEKGRKRELL